MTPCGELVGNDWRIVFFRAGDRIAHRVELAANGGYEPLLESAEGTPAEPWPASPALQQVHFQVTSDGRRAALLVGMAGRSHWSASVEVSGDGDQAIFDVACRAKSPPEWLGSTYQMIGQRAVDAALTRPGPQGDEHGAATAKVGPVTLVSESVPPATPPPWTIGPQRLRLAVQPPGARWPQTIAWRYVLQFRP